MNRVSRSVLTEVTSGLLQKPQPTKPPPPPPPEQPRDPYGARSSTRTQNATTWLKKPYHSQTKVLARGGTTIITPNHISMIDAHTCEMMGTQSSQDLVVEDDDVTSPRSYLGKANNHVTSP